ncbi:hypothetical protein KUTeg_013489 [Tegillarca granosa]|uniref:Asparaginase n=1 Tax=Tegillarca granosa TaxID=220873 RepID=A0ABQ9ETX1_TEGGR|nr:hypothetical protein KUTeg_013489 [Tegillarca granosa]
MNQTPVIVIHGGAWAIPDDLAEASVEGVIRAAKTGYATLLDGGSAVDAVENAVKVLEDEPAFDAGTGSVLNSNGEVEMDAVIMDGKTLSAGGTDHVLLVGNGANQFAEEIGMERVQTEELVTEEGRKEYEHFLKFKTTVNVLFRNRDNSGHDTVGTVAMDKNGNVAFGTSTGGITAKRPGRVGDSPIIGSGGYADNVSGAVSTTGHGESIMKVCLARHVTYLMEQGMSAQEASEKAL